VNNLTDKTLSDSVNSTNARCCSRHLLPAVAQHNLDRELHLTFLSYCCFTILKHLLLLA
jgi:hypothetical protein